MDTSFGRCSKRDTSMFQRECVKVKHAKSAHTSDGKTCPLNADVYPQFGRSSLPARSCLGELYSSFDQPGFTLTPIAGHSRP